MLDRAPGRPGLLRRLASIVPSYVELAWWGLASPRLSEREPLVVYQGVVLREGRIALAVRNDLQGWELPGGNAIGNEGASSTLAREVREELGLLIRVERHVGDYVRTGFRPHTARVYTCSVIGGELRPSFETPVVSWFDVDRVPTTLLPWYRLPLADALDPTDVPRKRRDHQGLASIWAGVTIDLRMRISGYTAGLPEPTPAAKQKGPSA